MSPITSSLPHGKPWDSTQHVTFSNCQKKITQIKTKQNKKQTTTKKPTEIRTNIYKTSTNRVTSLLLPESLWKKLRLRGGENKKSGLRYVYCLKLHCLQGPGVKGLVPKVLLLTGYGTLRNGVSQKAWGHRGMPRKETGVQHQKVSGFFYHTGSVMTCYVTQAENQ